MMRGIVEEIWDEVTDFTEDFWEHLTQGKPSVPARKKVIAVHGVLTSVRPAYLFAERIDNTLKIVFGLSIAVSAMTATFLGFTKLSDLLDVLITSFWGRTVMILIGASYFITSLWKLLQLGEKTQPDKSP